MMLLPLLLAPPAQAREGCTDRDFIGAFGFLSSDTVVRSPVTELTGPFARLGRFESDGNGNLVFSSTTSFNGILIPQDFTGVSKMHPDCTFETTVFLPDPINLRVNFEGMLSDNGDEMRDLFVSPPGLVIHGPGRKMKLSACTNRDLAGAFQLEMAGSILQPDRSRMPFSALGRITADGAGGFSGKLGSNSGGLTAVGEKISGTYTVASTCLFEMKYFKADEGRGPNDGVKLKGRVDRRRESGLRDDSRTEYRDCARGAQISVIRAVRSANCAGARGKYACVDVKNYYSRGGSWLC